MRGGLETHKSAVRKIRAISPEVQAFYVGYEISVTFYMRHTTRRKPAYEI